MISTLNLNVLQKNVDSLSSTNLFPQKELRQKLSVKISTDKQHLV